MSGLFSLVPGRFGRRGEISGLIAEDNSMLELTGSVRGSEQEGGGHGDGGGGVECRRASFLIIRTLLWIARAVAKGKHSAPKAAKLRITSAGMYSIREFTNRSLAGNVCTHNSLHPTVCSILTRIAPFLTGENRTWTIPKKSKLQHYTTTFA